MKGHAKVEILMRVVGDQSEPRLIASGQLPLRAEVKDLDPSVFGASPVYRSDVVTLLRSAADELEGPKA